MFLRTLLLIGISTLLVAGPGRDKVFGGAGNDVLVAGHGPDALFGGAGDDMFLYYENPLSGDLTLAERFGNALFGHDRFLGGSRPADDLSIAVIVRTDPHGDVSLSPLRETLPDSGA